MKHPGASICVDFIVEFSKAKTPQDEKRICKRFESLLFTHFENSSDLSVSKKFADVNLIVAFSLCQHIAEFTFEYLTEICESEPTLRLPCYIAYSTLDKVGCLIPKSVWQNVWEEFIRAPINSPALHLMSSTQPSRGYGQSALFADVIQALINCLGSDLCSATYKRRCLCCLRTYAGECSDEVSAGAAIR
jgi:hypothetical protein